MLGILGLGGQPARRPCSPRLDHPGPPVFGRDLLLCCAVHSLLKRGSQSEALNQAPGQRFGSLGASPGWWAEGQLCEVKHQRLLSSWLWVEDVIALSHRLAMQ